MERDPSRPEIRVSLVPSALCHRYNVLSVESQHPLYREQRVLQLESSSCQLRFLCDIESTAELELELGDDRKIDRSEESGEIGYDKEIEGDGNCFNRLGRKYPNLRALSILRSFKRRPSHVSSGFGPQRGFYGRDGESLARGLKLWGDETRRDEESFQIR